MHMKGNFAKLNNSLSAADMRKTAVKDLFESLMTGDFLGRDVNS